MPGAQKKNMKQTQEKTQSVFTLREDADSTVFYLTQEEDLEEDAARMSFLLGAARCGLVTVPVRDWNRELSPWEAPPVFGDRAFGKGAPSFLDEVLETVRFAGEMTGKEQRAILAGYSLAGLFALWAGTRTDAFSGIVAASPSVWFPGFGDYRAKHPVTAQAVYLSLGDREARTRNPVMARVADAIRTEDERLGTQGIPHVLEWNPGNHFQDPQGRTAKGILWTLDRIRKQED